MSGVIEISAEAERPETGARAGFPRRTRHEEKPLAGQLAAHQFPAREHTDEAGEETLDGILEGDSQQRRDEEEDRERERRIYRGRTVAMLRRYMRYSIETGRMPSLLGAEFFRAKVTAYTVVTFEDRVIFVHDMEKCLDRLDEFFAAADCKAYSARTRSVGHGEAPALQREDNTALYASGFGLAKSDSAGRGVDEATRADPEKLLSRGRKRSIRRK